MGVAEPAPLPARIAIPLVLPQAHGPDRGIEHFIIASDDDVFRHVVHAALLELGRSGTFVRSGAEALESVSASRPTLLILDQSAPGLAGPAGLGVAQALGAACRRFILVGQNLATSVTVAAMKLGAFTVLEKPVRLIELVALLQEIAGEPRAAHAGAISPGLLALGPRSVAERWALKVLRGCEAECDVKTLGMWATVAGSSYSSLCEICRLLDIQPLAARDLTRVLRAVVQSRRSGCRIGEVLDVCDRRTLNALMARAGLDPRRYGRDISTGQFLAAQQFVPAGNAGLVVLQALIMPR